MTNEKPGAPDDPRAARLESFAAEALDFPAVRALLERLAWTSLGRRAVRELAPLDEPAARAALDRAAEALAAGPARLPSLAGVSDPWPGIEEARRGARALDEDRLVALRSFLEAARRLGEWLLAHEVELPALGALGRGMPDLSDLAARIDRVVDERGRVRDDASELLARLREEIALLERTLERRLKDLIGRHELRVVLSDTALHRRGGRSVLAVRAKARGRVPGIVHDHSQSGETVFVEPHEVVEAGNRLSECRADERREVGRILLELLRAVLASSDALHEAAERLAALELALIAGRFAADQDARVPAVDPVHGRHELVLRQARHPLLVEQVREGTLTEVVPIDLRLGGDFDLLVLTGPNTGGKTLALKTAGLCALLVRCGLPVPCGEGSRVPLFEGVVADIGDEQEIRQSLSTFSSHLARIRAGLARAGPRTLFLLDELGGGTDPEQGAALSEALLEHLVTHGIPTLASTHIGRLKEFGFRVPRAENACVEFDPASLAPRYRVLIGRAGESAALVVARSLGLPESIVARAEERLERRDDEVLELIDALGHARTEAEEKRSRVDTQLARAEAAARAVEERRAELERKGELLEEEAQRDVETRVREARRHLERARSLLEQVEPSQRRLLAEALAALEAELSGAALGERRRRFLAGLSKGDFVWLPRFRRRCLIERIDRERRELSVRMGGASLRVSFDEVASHEGP